MWQAVRKFFEELFEPWPSSHRKLALEASATAQGEASSTLVVLADASYLPHGGHERITLRLRGSGGHVDRRRTPHRGDPKHCERDLTAEECEHVVADLHARDIWNLGDQRESVRDGLVCGFAFAHGGRVHSLQLHCGAADSRQLQLLRFLGDLAPMAEPASFAYTTAAGEIGLRGGD
jgi:hypothetical protein